MRRSWIFGAVGDAVRGVPVGHRLRASVHKIRHEAHAAGSYRRVLLHHAVRGVLPARGRGVLDAGHLRGGCSKGGIQALSRSEFGKLIPKEHANEYYGFFDIFGKYAAVMGTFLVSFFTQLSGNSSLGVLSIAVLFVLGFVLLWRMPGKAGVERAARGVLRPPRRGRLVSGLGLSGCG